MPLSTVSLSGVGTKTEYEDPTTPGAYITLVNAVTIGAVGNKGGFIENTPILSVDPTYIAGDREAEDKEIVMNDVPGDADQEGFLTLCDSKAVVSVRITFPTGKISTFSMATNGFKRNEPTRDGALTVSAFGKRSGAVAWTSVA